MKKQKWYLVDTTNKNTNNEEESGVRPMPELATPRANRFSIPSKKTEDEENSLLKHAGRNEKYSKESVVDWDNAVTRQTFVQHYERWEGRVVEIHEDTFVARLTDSKGERMPRIVKIKKTLVNKADWNTFFQEGFEFEWLFKEVVTNGTFCRKNEIRFTPVTRYLPDEVEEFVKMSMSEFSYMLKKDD